MKSVRMFTMESCPFCKQAHRWMDELFEEYPQYRQIPLDIVDEVEQPEFADQFDYYYVPTYYVGDEKVHEGAATKDGIRQVFETALLADET